MGGEAEKSRKWKIGGNNIGGARFSKAICLRIVTGAPALVPERWREVTPGEGHVCGPRKCGLGLRFTLWWPGAGELDPGRGEGGVGPRRQTLLVRSRGRGWDWARRARDRERSMPFAVGPVGGGSAQTPWASRASSPPPLLITAFHPEPCI